VTRGLPEFEIENVWRENFSVASYSVLVSDNLNKIIVDMHTLRVHEGTAWGKLVHVE